MVQRYEFELYHCNGGDMSPDDNGAYVSYEDYAALEERLGKVQGQLERLSRAYASLTDKDK